MSIKRILTPIFLALMSILIVSLIDMGKPLMSVATATPTLTFNVTGCDHNNSHSSEQSSYLEDKLARQTATATNIVVTTQNGNINFSHDLNYVCCADIQLEKTIENNIITILEVNQGRTCRCLCHYSVNASISSLSPGTYSLRVYGVKYISPEGGFGYEPDLLFTQELSL